MSEHKSKKMKSIYLESKGSVKYSADLLDIPFPGPG